MHKIITIKKDFLIDEKKLRDTINTINFDNITGNDKRQYFYLQNNYLFNRHIHHITTNCIDEMRSIFLKNINLYKKAEQEIREQAYERHKKEHPGNTYIEEKTEDTLNFEHYLKKYNIQSALEQPIKSFLSDTRIELKAERHKINQKEIKRAKLSITDSLLLEILNNLCDAEEEPYKLKSKDTYALNTYNINSELHQFYFSMQELDDKLDKKKAENDFIEVRKLQEKNLEDLDLREYRFVEKKKKNVGSLITKIKRAEEDIELHLEEIDEDKRANEKKRLEKNIKNDKKKLSDLKKKNKQEIKKFMQKVATDRKTFTDSIESALNIYSAKIKNININIQKAKEDKSKYIAYNKDMRIKKKNEEYFFANPLKPSLSHLSTIEIKNITRKKPDLMLNTLNYLKAHGLIIQEDICEDGTFYYKLNLEEIFSKAEHPIVNKSILGASIPLFIAYLKYIPTHNVESFLDNIDIFLEYSLQPPEKFSTENKNEDTLIEALNREKAINITLKNSNTISHVEDFYLYYDDNDYEKYLSLTIPELNIENMDSIEGIYYINKQKQKINILNKKDDFYKTELLSKAIENNEKLMIEIYPNVILSNVTATVKDTEQDKENKYKTTIKSITISNAYAAIKIQDIELVTICQDTKDNKSVDDQSISTNNSNFMSHKQKYAIPNKKLSNTILEVDIHLTEFFEVKPLKNQIIYKTPKKIELFLKENGLEFVQTNKGETIKRDTKNKVYITAKDTKDNIIHVTKRSIPNVKILEPTVINEEFKAILKSICDE